MSNFHFVPRAPRTESTIQTQNVASLSLEEAVPIAIGAGMTKSARENSHCTSAHRGEYNRATPQEGQSGYTTLGCSIFIGGYLHPRLGRLVYVDWDMSYLLEHATGSGSDRESMSLSRVPREICQARRVPRTSRSSPTARYHSPSLLTPQGRERPRPSMRDTTQLAGIRDLPQV